MSIGVAILALAVLVLVHEAGHFFAARAVGMRPRRFYIGFPPAIVKTVRGGVEYGIGAIPLGGYVKIPGMHRAAPGDLRASLDQEKQDRHAAELDELDDALERGDEDAARAVLARLEPELGSNRMFAEHEGSLAPDAYWRQTTWKRIVVIGAGPAVNVLVAVLLFTGVYMVGSIVVTRTIDQVRSGHPAAAAGLRPGDKIVTIAGHRITPDTLAQHISATAGRPFTVTVLRDGRRLTLGPLRARKDQGVYRIGIVLRATSGPGSSLPVAVWKSVVLGKDITTGTVSGIVGLFHAQGTRQISSTVGIVRDTAAAYRASTQDFLFVVGYISLALALLNLLPILPLDGGHIVMSVLEGVRGRAFSQLAYLRFSAVGMTIFLLLLYLGLRNDLFSGGS
jgi:regulator of sigma E protease